MATIYAAVRLATNTNIVLGFALQPGVSLIDGVIINANDRVLIKSQSDRTQNGLYYLNGSGQFVRTSDFANLTTHESGNIVFVTEGDNFKDTGWIIATDGVITVGSTQIEYQRFSINTKLLGADAPSSVILRKDKGYPLTNEELDDNFKYLAFTLTQKLNIVDFNSITVRDKINALSAAEANLDAWKLHGYLPDTFGIADTIAQRDTAGDLTANVFHGDLEGNADTATLAVRATIANNVDGIVAVANGGTGSSTKEAARASLEVVNIAGDTMTGKLTLPVPSTAGASINLPPQASAPLTVNLSNGDVWSNSTHLKYRLNDKTLTVAPIEDPIFTGAPQAPTADIASNGTIIATTGFVKAVKAIIDAAVALKAPIENPSLTGTPKSITADTAIDTNGANKTMIATVEYVAKKIAKVLEAYSTTAQVASMIATALLDYDTKTGVNTKISNALASYYTKTNIDNLIALYKTSSQTDTAISNAVTVKANTTYVDSLQDKWGSSRKFVQSDAPSGAVDGDFWFKI